MTTFHDQCDRLILLIISSVLIKARKKTMAMRNTRYGQDENMLSEAKYYNALFKNTVTLLRFNLRTQQQVLNLL